MLFQDVESGSDFYVDPGLIKSDYQRKLQRHSEQVEGICRNLGFAFHRLVTSQPLELALLDFLRSRNRRGKLIRRRTQRTGSL